MDNKKKKKKQKIGKVNPVLYAFIYLALKRKYTKKYNITFDKKIVKDIKGPAIVLATHMSDADHILSALSLYPVRPTYIISEHFMHIKSSAVPLKLMHVITKKMFTPDISTVRKILRAKAENAVLVLFHLRAGADDDSALSCSVCVLDSLRAVNYCRRGEVGTLDVVHKLVNGTLGVIHAENCSVNYLS